MEKKELEKKTRVLLALILGALIILFLRLGFLQLVKADEYRTLARQNHLRLTRLSAPRGEIFDRKGVRIVSNRPVYTISLTNLGLKESAQVVNYLAELLQGEKSFQGKTRAQIKTEIQAKITKFTKNREVEEKFPLGEPIKIARDITPQTIFKIEEQRLKLPGVVVDVEPERKYPYGDLLVPVAGYIGEINEHELAAHKDEGYYLKNLIGKEGLEKFYEPYLRGTPGARQVEVNALGRPVRDLGIKEAVPGNNLFLTIDAHLQRLTQDALAQGIKRALTAGYPKARAGAAVALSVYSGEILAMASYPAYDPNIFVGGIREKDWAEVNEKKALINRALSRYPPGSTFKMVTATAALESKKITGAYALNCTGYYKYKKDWKPHGRVDLRKALQVSCDVFFWTLGVLTGPEKMAYYAREYGLGEKTGVDLPGEEAGRVPNPAQKYEKWQKELVRIKKEIDQIRQENRSSRGKLADLEQKRSKIEWELKWREYDTLDMAIGQGDNYYSPLQLANYLAAMVNEGIVYRPYLVKKIVTPDGRLLRKVDPQEVRKVNASTQTLKIIKEGLHLTTLPPAGTAAGVFAGVPYKAGAKTGTAEVHGHDNHALILAFAPYEKPEIAVAVVIEYGGKGSGMAGPVARQILDGYFDLAKTKLTLAPEETGQSLADQPPAQNRPPELKPRKLTIQREVYQE
ncbi:MAG TPA: penicillin-binding protein 2 [Desulfotomaculum sp.]|jgi:penicillin-binding protein 2|nr:penicillin-binding protein 2 [Desulfotomaculum sp.]HCJ78682.1 penicillin-binding protein 2 [Desulfotomaculum sp.]